MCIYHSVCGDAVLKFYSEDGADNIHHQQLINIIVYIYTSICIIMFASMCVYYQELMRATKRCFGTHKLLILCMYVYVLMHVYNSNKLIDAKAHTNDHTQNHTNN